MISKITRPIDGHRAGRFVLAIADDNAEQVVELMGEIATDESATAMLAFAAELASISISLAEKYVGSDWRSVLGSALLDHEMSHPNEPADDDE